MSGRRLFTLRPPERKRATIARDFAAGQRCGPGHANEEIRSRNPQELDSEPSHERSAERKSIRRARDGRRNDVLGVIDRRVTRPYYRARPHDLSRNPRLS